MLSVAYWDIFSRGSLCTTRVNIRPRHGPIQANSWKVRDIRRFLLQNTGHEQLSPHRRFPTPGRLVRRLVLFLGKDRTEQARLYRAESGAQFLQSATWTSAGEGSRFQKAARAAKGEIRVPNQQLYRHKSEQSRPSEKGSKEPRRPRHAAVAAILYARLWAYCSSALARREEIRDPPADQTCWSYCCLLYCDLGTSEDSEIV